MRALTRLCVFASLCARLAAQAPYERIVNAWKEPDSWLTYSGNYQGHRFSPLNQITTANVARLRVQWASQFREPNAEVSPLVADGIMYVTGPQMAAALDLHSGRELWTWRRPLPWNYHSLGFGQANRGAAILDNTLYVATLDCYLVALDAKSGAVRWSTKVQDYRSGYSMTMAPLAIRGKVVVGISGGDAGIRGFIDAYDAKTGKRAWRFWTIPGPGEPGHETWPADAWKTGGGATWVTGSYDPELNLIYWGVGNPGPNWNPGLRPGDNLYTCSLVALNGDTGALRWHFQFTPHDSHDWDANHVPVLFDAEIRGGKRKLLAVANRNAFYYVLDRTSGEFVAGSQYSKQTWAKGLDDHGRPMVLPNREPAPEGRVVSPAPYGATNWFSPAYSPKTGLFYVGAREIAAVYYRREAEYKPGSLYSGGGNIDLPPDGEPGAIRALEVTTGKRRWEFPLPSAPWAGVLATAGGLVFSGSNEGNFFALDAATGKPLWDFQTGGPITANPISFAIDGRQCIAVAASRVLYVFGL